MTSDGEAAALRDASTVLRRLAAQVEDGNLVVEDEAAAAMTAAWRGASAALAQAVAPAARRD